MKSVFLFLSAFVFCVKISTQPPNHSLIEEKYRKRYELLDTTVFFYKVLEIGKFRSGNLYSVAIPVRRDVEGKTVTFFLDSLMYFHKSGHLKFIQASDSIGTPTFTRMYDKNGNLARECKFNYTGVIPYQPTDKASNKVLECYGKKYKGGILLSEGRTVGGKKEGLHIIYDKNENIKSRIIYSKGKAIKQSN